MNSKKTSAIPRTDVVKDARGENALRREFGRMTSGLGVWNGDLNYAESGGQIGLSATMMLNSTHADALMPDPCLNCN